MQTIHDDEFGDIKIRTHRNARRLSLKVAPNGTLYASVPPRTPRMAVQMLIRSSRAQIRELVTSQRPSYMTSQAIGKSHMLVIQTGSRTDVYTDGTKIILTLHESDEVGQPEVQAMVRTHILKALRKEAKSYLPRRLAYLAAEHDFSYEAVKLTHASSRWGSCSSRGIISLNISLMGLPFTLIDYVLIHELCHTRHMNHSTAFWSEVGAILPDYTPRRTALKQHTPHI